jgi:hypothetical protein
LDCLSDMPEGFADSAFHGGLSGVSGPSPRDTRFVFRSIQPQRTQRRKNSTA